MSSGTAQFHVPVKPLLELAAEDRLSDELVVSLAGQPALRDAGEYLTPNTKILLALVITAVQDEYDWDIITMQACARVFEEQGYVRLKDLAAMEELELALYTAHPDFPATMIDGLKAPTANPNLADRFSQAAIQRAHHSTGTNGGAPSNQLPAIEGIGKRRLEDTNQSQPHKPPNPATATAEDDGQPATKKHRPAIVLFHHPETHGQPVTSHPSTHAVNTQTTAVPGGMQSMNADPVLDFNGVGEPLNVHGSRYARRQGHPKSTDWQQGAVEGQEENDALSGGRTTNSEGEGEGEGENQSEEEESEGDQSESSPAEKPKSAKKEKRAGQPPAAAAAAAASETSDQESVSSPAPGEGPANTSANPPVQPMYPPPYPWAYPWPYAPQFFRPMPPPMPPQKPLATRYHTLHVGGGRKERFSVSKTINLRPPKPPQQPQPTVPMCGAGSDSDVGQGDTLRFYDVEEKLICPFGCGKGFNSRDKLDDHANTHTGKKPYVCPKEGCGKAMPTKQALTMHQSRAHSNDLPHKFVCPTFGCGATFPFKSSLDRHVRDGQHNSQPAAAVRPGGQPNADINLPGQQIRPAPAQPLQNVSGGFKFNGCQMCTVPYCGRWLYTRAEYDKHIAEHQKSGQGHYAAGHGNSGNGGGTHPPPTTS